MKKTFKNEIDAFMNNIPDAMGIGNIWGPQMLVHEAKNVIHAMDEAIADPSRPDSLGLIMKKGCYGSFVYCYSHNSYGDPISVVGMPYRVWQEVSKEFPWLKLQ